MRTPIQWLSDTIGLSALQRETKLLREALPQIVIALEKETTKVYEELQHIGRNHAGAINDLHMRLGYYENTVPSLAHAKKALQNKIKRERAKREALVALHPELSDEGKQYVLQTGQLPPTTAKPQADGGEGPESEAEMRAAEDATRDRELALVREAEGDAIGGTAA